MRHLATDLGVIVLAAALAAPATAGEPPAPAAPASAVRVRELLVLAGVSRQGELLVDQLIRVMRSSKPELPVSFWDELKSAIGSGEFVDLLVPVYQKHVSAADVEAAIAYWKSAPGRRFQQAQAAIMAESEKVGREWGLVLVKRMKTKLAAAPARELTGAVVIEPRFYQVEEFSGELAMISVWK